MNQISGNENWIVPYEDKYRTEVKYDDHTATNQLIDPTPLWVSGYVNFVEQGSGASERVGRKIHVLRCYLRGIIFQQQDADANLEVAFTMRIIVVNDKQPTFGSITDVSEYLAEISTISPIKMSNRRRFETFYDKTFDLDAFRTNTGTTPNRGSMLNRMWHSFQAMIDIERDVMYGNNGGADSITTNALIYYILVDNKLAAASDQNTGSWLKMNVRSYYTDK